MITRREGLGVDAIHSVTEDSEGRIWLVGGGKRPYWLLDGVAAETIPSPQSDGFDSVWAVLADRNGALWIATYHGKVFRYANGSLKLR